MSYEESELRKSIIDLEHKQRKIEKRIHDIYRDRMATLTHLTTSGASAAEITEAMRGFDMMLHDLRKEKREYLAMIIDLEKMLDAIKVT